jgi:hypothetical protein
MPTEEQKARVERIIEDALAPRGKQKGYPPLPPEYIEDARQSWYDHFERVNRGEYPDIVILESGPGDEETD